MKRVGFAGAVAVVASMLLAGGAPISPVSAADDDACPGTIDETLVITHKIAPWTACTVHLAAGVVVKGGGELAVQSAAVVFDPPGDQIITIRVERDGVLRIDDTTIDAEAPGSMSNRIVLDAGAKGGMTNVQVRGVTGIETRSNHFEFSAVTIQDATGPAGLNITDASPGRLEGINLVGGLTGVRLEGATHAAFTELTTDTSLVGLHGAPGTTAVVDSGTLNADSRAVLLRGDAHAILRNASFGESVVQARLESESDADPHLRLEGTPFDADAFEFQGNGHAEVAWFVEANVEWTGVSPPPSSEGIQVTFRNKDGEDVAEGTTDVGGAAVSLVPDHGIDGTTTQRDEQNPYRILVRKGSSVASFTDQVIQENREVVLPLPHDADTDRPVWADGTAVLGFHQNHQPPGFSHDGRVHLAWPVADDTVGGAEPQRGIDYYEVAVLEADQDPRLVTTTRTDAVVEGIPAGTHTFQVRPVDLAGNAGWFSNTLTVFVDLVPPSVNVTINGTVGPKGGHYADAVEVNVTAADDETEITSIEYRVNEQSIVPYAGNFTLADDGRYNVTVRAANAAGGTSDAQLPTIVIDRQPPSILSVKLSPGVPDGTLGWWKSPPAMTITAIDQGPSGIESIRWRPDAAGEWQPYEESQEISIEGEYVMLIEAVDGAGNVATSSMGLNLDATPPVVEASLIGPEGDNGWYRGPVHVEANRSDALSGIARLSFRLGEGAWNEYTDLLVFTHAGSQPVTFQALDKAGNPSDEETVTVRIDAQPPVLGPIHWSIEEDGDVHVRLADGPSFDAVSGVARLVVEQADIEHRPLRGFDVDVTASNHTLGPFAVGEYRFRLRAIDQAGNEEASAWQTLEIIESAGGLQAPGQERSVRGLVELRFEPVAGFEPAEVRFYVDGVLKNAVAEPPYTFQWNTRQVPDGGHEVRVVAQDAAGRAHEEFHHFEVRNAYQAVIADTLPAFATALAAASLAAAVSVAAFRAWGRFEPA